MGGFTSQNFELNEMRFLKAAFMLVLWIKDCERKNNNIEVLINY